MVLIVLETYQTLAIFFSEEAGKEAGKVFGDWAKKKRSAKRELFFKIADAPLSSLKRDYSDLFFPLPIGYDDLTDLKPIRQGAFGVVSRGVYGDIIVAVKAQKCAGMGAYTRESFLKEARIQFSIRHANVVPLVGLVELDHELLLVMPCCNQKILIKKFSRPEQLSSHKSDPSCPGTFYDLPKTTLRRC